MIRTFFKLDIQLLAGIIHFSLEIIHEEIRTLLNIMKNVKGILLRGFMQLIIFFAIVSFLLNKL